MPTGGLLESLGLTDNVNSTPQTKKSPPQPIRKQIQIKQRPQPPQQRGGSSDWMDEVRVYFNSGHSWKESLRLASDARKARQSGGAPQVSTKTTVNISNKIIGSKGNNKSNSTGSKGNSTGSKGNSKVKINKINNGNNGNSGNNGKLSLDQATAVLRNYYQQQLKEKHG